MVKRLLIGYPNDGTGGGPSAFGFPFRPGDGKDGGSQGKHANDQGGEQKRDRLFIHNTLTNQQSAADIAPTTITFQLGLSMLMNGVSTVTAKNTLPALSKMLDNRSNWLDVSTGSLGAMKMIPDVSITDDDSTGENVLQLCV